METLLSLTEDMLNTNKFETDVLFDTFALRENETYHTIYDNVIVPVKRKIERSTLWNGIEHNSTVILWFIFIRILSKMKWIKKVTVIHLVVIKVQNKSQKQNGKNRLLMI